MILVQILITSRNMTDKYNQELSGDSHQTPQSLNITKFFKERLEHKNKIFEARYNIRKGLKNYMSRLLPYSSVSTENGSAKQMGNYASSRSIYGSSYMIEARDALVDRKISADYALFEAEDSEPGDQDSVDAENLTKIDKRVVAHSGKEYADIAIADDLFYGEAFYIQQPKKRLDGEMVKLVINHIPWENVRWLYGDTDAIVLEWLTVSQLVDRYGDDIVNKVTYGGVLDDSTENSIKFNGIEEMDLKEMVQVARYWDSSRLRYFEVVGGGGYVVQELEGDRYPWTNDDKEGYCPVKQKIAHYKHDGHHYYGWADLVFPFAQLDTMLTNSTAKLSLQAADPLLVFFGDDIKNVEKQWRQHSANIKRGNHGKPFFAPSNGNNPLKFEKIETTPNLTVFQQWQDFIIKTISRLTKVDFFSYMDPRENTAPTKYHEQKRMMLFKKASLKLLSLNQESDKQAALERMYILQSNPDMKFNERKIRARVSELKLKESGMLTPEQIAMQADKDGLIYVRKTIKEVLSKIKNIDFKVEPRIDGIRDDQTEEEIEAMESALLQFQMYPQVHRKLSQSIAMLKYGRANITPIDFQPPPPMQPEQPLQPEQLMQ